VRTHTAKRYRVEAAYHEAGHVVVRIVLGLAVRRVYILPVDRIAMVQPGELYGRAVHAKPFRVDLTRRFGHSRSRLNTRLRIEAEIMVAYAGPLAETRASGRRRREGSCGDREAAVSTLRFMRLCDSEREERAYLVWLRARTENLLADRVTWLAIEMVAGELLRCGQLTGKRLAELVSRRPGSPRLAPAPIVVRRVTVTAPG
jgi:hypothetical protein